MLLSSICPSCATTRLLKVVIEKHLCCIAA
jgi:hypothetical protein